MVSTAVAPSASTPDETSVAVLTAGWSPDELRAMVSQEIELRSIIVDYYRSQMIDKKHYYTLQAGQKPALSKEGALNLCSLFKVRVAAEPPSEQYHDDGHYSVRYRVHLVKIMDKSLEFSVSDYGTIQVAIVDRRIKTTLPEGKPAPDWLRATPVKFDARPDPWKRVQVSRAKIEIHRYFSGWENFFFPFNSKLTAYSEGEIVSLIFSDQRLDPEKSNWENTFYLIILTLILVITMDKISSILRGRLIQGKATQNG